MPDNAFVTRNLLNLYSHDGRLAKINLWFFIRLSGLWTMSRDCEILDCGCGNGRLIKALQQTGFKNITGIDASPEMVSECSHLKGVSIVHSDVLEMSKYIVDGRFDVVIISNMMHHLPSEEAWGVFLGNCNKALKTGGFLVIREPEPTIMTRLIIWMSKKKIFYLGALRYILQSFVEEKELLEYFFLNWVPRSGAITQKHGFVGIKDAKWLVHRFTLCRKE